MSDAPLLTSLTLLATSAVPLAASATLRLISVVVAPCCSTAAAMPVAISEDAADGAGDFPDGVDGVLRCELHAGDLRADFARGLFGLAGECLDLLCDDRKALSSLAGACGLDGGIESQKVGLTGNGVDQADNVADALSRLRELRTLELVRGRPALPPRRRYCCFPGPGG